MRNKRAKETARSVDVGAIIFRVPPARERRRKALRVLWLDSELMGGEEERKWKVE